MKTRYILPLVLAVAAAVMSSCSAVRGCKPANVPVPLDLAGRADSASVADIDWWTFYSDTTLNTLITRTLENNRDFMAAAATVVQMKELYGAANAELFPVINGNAYANRETNDYKDEKPLRDPEIGVKASLSWEADLWGNLRWNKRKGQAAYNASVEEWRAMRITLIAETASAYFNLVALDNELDIVQRTLETRKEELEKAKLRYEGGLTSEITYLQAQVEYNTAASLLPVIEKKIETTQNAIALLIGDLPGTPIARNPQTLTTPLPESVPVGIPSQLLQRRPDIRASAAKLAQAMAGVGVAYTDRFPKLTLTLTGGVENNAFANLFESPFSFIAGAIAGPIFDFGKRKKKYKAALAQYDNARYSYEQKVLAAFGETANAITGYAKAREIRDTRTTLRNAAMKYMNLAHLQYSAGNISYLDVLDAQRRYLDAEISNSNAARDEMLALVQLYKSLGGGWNISNLPAPLR
jgi:multidrug efflux system outer membrane protein